MRFKHKFLLFLKLLEDCSSFGGAHGAKASFFLLQGLTLATIFIFAWFVHSKALEGGIHDFLYFGRSVLHAADPQEVILTILRFLVLGPSWCGLPDFFWHRDVATNSFVAVSFSLCFLKLLSLFQPG